MEAYKYCPNLSKKEAEALLHETIKHFITDSQKILN